MKILQPGYGGCLRGVETHVTHYPPTLLTHAVLAALEESNVHQFDVCSLLFELAQGMAQGGHTVAAGPVGGEEGGGEGGGEESEEGEEGE